jgi:hypothetical protein
MSVVGPEAAAAGHRKFQVELLGESHMSGAQVPLRATLSVAASGNNAAAGPQPASTGYGDGGGTGLQPGDVAYDVDKTGAHALAAGSMAPTTVGARAPGEPSVPPPDVARADSAEPAGAPRPEPASSGWEATTGAGAGVHGAPHSPVPADGSWLRGCVLDFNSGTGDEETAGAMACAHLPSSAPFPTSLAPPDLDADPGVSGAGPNVGRAVCVNPCLSEVQTGDGVSAPTVAGMGLSDGEGESELVSDHGAKAKLPAHAGSEADGWPDVDPVDTKTLCTAGGPAGPSSPQLRDPGTSVAASAVANCMADPLHRAALVSEPSGSLSHDNVGQSPPSREVAGQQDMREHTRHPAGSSAPAVAVVAAIGPLTALGEARGEPGAMRAVPVVILPASSDLGWKPR